ncbi:13850_t:CDS:1 [Acaulospora colombiana]|uniref:13850_t:CDS:1 n=1 Tax=Acaulospora colombiana TaxID=27376 RepID=A0ACA9KRK4_9GLOM|nr:13850_t:CDS:1 [Acaulospora colombiana]
MVKEETKTLEHNAGSNQRKRFISIGIMMFVEVVLPIILYYILEGHLPTIWALVISGVPPLIAVIFGIVRHRRVDITGVLVIFSFVIGAVVATVQGDPKLYLLRESFFTGVIGLVFLITLIPFKFGSFQMRPIVFYLAKDMQTGGTFSSGDRTQASTDEETIAESWERYWGLYPKFREGFIIMTAVWGLGLLLEVVLRVIIIFETSTVDQAVYIAAIVTYSWIALLVVFTIIYSRWMAKQGQKRRLEMISSQEQHG